MLISCRYVSNDCSTIGDREFDEIGQRASFSEQGFREVVLGGAAFIPEEIFARFQFSVKELDKYGPAGIRVNPPQEFSDKIARCQQLFREIRSRMLVSPQATLAELTNDQEIVGA